MSQSQSIASTLPDRKAVLNSASAITYDFLVIGGGIHGALFARLAATHGLKTLLVEQSDYASGTSSRSSKMAHGGLRYLEMFDFNQVREALHAREDLYAVAPHLAHPYPFYIPLRRNNFFNRIKLSLGLWLYDLFARAPHNRRHRWISPQNVGEKLPFAAFSGGNFGAFRFYDGIMDDAAIVMENILAARLAGAHCVNYVRVEHLSLPDSASFTTSDKPLRVMLTDVLSSKTLSTNARTVVNCSGPWISTDLPSQGDSSPKNPPLVLLSRGSHLIFDVPWPHPALLLPLPDKGRYYFVWPHPHGTMVGTTERQTAAVAPDPVPSKDEIEEILSRIEQDLPGSDLNRSKIHYAFAGLRVLPLRSNKKKKSGQLSRRHLWTFSNRVLALYGGKYTSALWTVEDGWNMLQEKGVLSKTFKSAILRGQLLPGSQKLGEISESFRSKGVEFGLSLQLINSVLSRNGALVSEFLRLDLKKVTPISGTVLREEIEIAIKLAQAETVEDVLRRRLRLESSPDHGIPLLGVVVELLEKLKPGRNHAQDAQEYCARMKKLTDLWKLQ